MSRQSAIICAVAWHARWGWESAAPNLSVSRLTGEQASCADVLSWQGRARPAAWCCKTHSLYCRRGLKV